MLPTPKNAEIEEWEILAEGGNVVPPLIPHTLKTQSPKAPAQGHRTQEPQPTPRHWSPCTLEELRAAQKDGRYLSAYSKIIDFLKMETATKDKEHLKIIASISL